MQKKRNQTYISQLMKKREDIKKEEQQRLKGVLEQLEQEKINLNTHYQDQMAKLDEQIEIEKFRNEAISKHK